MNLDTSFSATASDSDSPTSDRDSLPWCITGGGPPTFNLQPLNTRSVFFRIGGCRIHGHPSTGGILIKESANLVDMLFLSLPRFTSSIRDPDDASEDGFGDLLRRLGAVWWRNEHAWHRWQRRGIAMQSDEEESEGELELESQIKILVYGWPSDGAGAWILKFANKRDLPEGFGKLDYATSMDERIEVMKTYGARFVADSSCLEELEVTQNEPGLA